MKTPQFLVSLALVALFAFAYFSNPADEMMKGAMIAAFAAAYTFWLGSSSGSKASGDVVRQIATQPTVTATGDKPTIIAPAVSAEDDGEIDNGKERPPWER